VPVSAPDSATVPVSDGPSVPLSPLGPLVVLLLQPTAMKRNESESDLKT
jgi:hypothetical protein